eukprot:g64941.t1
MTSLLLLLQVSSALALGFPAEMLGRWQGELERKSYSYRDRNDYAVTVCDNSVIFKQPISVVFKDAQGEDGEWIEIDWDYINIAKPENFSQMGGDYTSCCYLPSGYMNLGFSESYSTFFPIQYDNETKCMTSMYENNDKNKYTIYANFNQTDTETLFFSRCSTSETQSHTKCVPDALPACTTDGTLDGTCVTAVLKRPQDSEGQRVEASKTPLLIILTLLCLVSLY